MEEKALIIDLKNGSEFAFRHLVETFQNKVFNTVLSILQNTDDAEDISQEVFIEVYESIQLFRGEAKLSTWIYRIATTKALEAYRKQKTAKRFAFFTSLFGQDNEAIHHPATFEHPGIELENKERGKVLFKAIDKLPDNQKVAFTLCNIEGLSYQEIAEVMQVSLSSVESLLFRARTILRKLLKEYYMNEEI
ncbi:RNA polymerase sigma factor [Emticicia sp. BO119]|uniref:RNA polymerase sigma factor n=1 Tax=Emticicia sp. BO119 TaxID=2757768 RepID=UPI0015F0EA63|nr:sigma-70 family RNA polymerase sigma factor [Emticicia sp. BO119]MBA4853111.1 sigma-70 family RNA polymerase sigma factor [Emticicia sp. BO119]